MVTTVLAAFGPYVWFGIRTEQAGVYGVLLLAVVAAPTLRRTSVRGPAPWWLLGLWATYIAVTAASSIGILGTPPRWRQGELMAGLDNVVLPLAVMLLVWLTVEPRRAQQMLSLVTRLVAVAMAGNGLLAMVMTQVDLSGILRPFWSSSTGMTTAEAAAGLGRLSGLFNHPAEAGAAYGLAGVCAWYAWQHRPTRFYGVLVPIVVGGLLTVSKIFVLGALPLVLWLVWRSRQKSSRLTLIFVSVCAVAGVLGSGLAARWSGFSYLQGILSPDDKDALAFFTAGRVGDDSTLLTVIREVTHINPLFGVGAEGLAVPYDNGWVEAYVTAGMIGVLAYTGALVCLWRSARDDLDPRRRLLLLVVTVLAAGGSMGVPVLTANRVATLFWLVCSLAVAAAWASRTGGLGDGRAEDTHPADGVGVTSDDAVAGSGVSRR